jgi:hypothetical protein
MPPLTCPRHISGRAHALPIPLGAKEPPGHGDAVHIAISLDAASAIGMSPSLAVSEWMSQRVGKLRH